MKPKPNILRVTLVAILLSTTVTPVDAVGHCRDLHRRQASAANDGETGNRRVCLGAGALAGGAGADRREQARTSRLRVSQRHPHRAKQREHRAARPPHAGWRLRYSRKGKGSRLHHLQGCGDAMDGTVDLDRDRHARRRFAGLPGFARLCASAVGVFQAPLHRDHQGRNGHNCGCNVRPARDGASGDDFFAGHTASRG